MRFFAVLSTVAAVAVAFPLSAIRAVTLSGPAIPGNRSCAPTGQKCAGAKDFPFVPYAGCCDKNLVCSPPKTPVSGFWGSFCIPESEALPNTNQTTTAPATTAPVTTAASDVTTIPGRTTVAGESTAATTVAVPTPIDAVPTPTPDATATPALATPKATPSRSPTPESSGKCFPSFATVELEDGSVISMDKVSIGDSVRVGPSTFSKVFMFTHKMQGGSHEFIELITASGATLPLTAGHYLPVEGSLVAASQVSIGSELPLGNGNLDKVVSIRKIFGTGLYNPQTLQGDIVVNGVVASTYTTAVEPVFAHAVLMPFRSLFKVFGYEVTSFDNGGGRLVDVAPQGIAAY